MKTRSGIPMTEAELEEWQKSFTDIEESIEGIEDQFDCPNPEYKKYMLMKQQELF